MFLIAEIILTAAVWRKGWKAKAFLPLALALVVGFLIELSAGLYGTGTGGGHRSGVGVFLDLVMIGAQVFMLRFSLQRPRVVVPHRGKLPGQPAPVG